MLSFQRLKHPMVVFAHDLLAIPLAWLGAYWLRFNFQTVPTSIIEQAVGVLPWLVLIQAALFWETGLYRGVWRYASMPDVTRIIKAVMLGAAISALFLFLINRMAFIPRSIFPIYAAILMALLGGSRFLYRWLKDGRENVHHGKRTLIIGAGRGAESLLRHMLRDMQSGYRPIGLVDDEREVLGKEIHGVRVIGTRSQIPDLVRVRAIERIVIAVPDSGTGWMRETLEICERTGVPVSTLPNIHELVEHGLDESVAGTNLRDVSIDDLLGRDPVMLDWDGIRSSIYQRTVLVSGGGGSIGSELCAQIAKLKPSCLVVIDISEYNLYELNQRLATRFPQIPLFVRLVDVSDRVAVAQVFQEFKPTAVFHAAAYKHVPMLETQIRAAVKNNVLGTRVMADVAHEYGTSVFVLISTDKAVNPTNIMGMTKRVAEVYCQYMSSRSATHFITVRFGNVLGSAGSVVPLFKSQIEAGGPVTVTHPEISRYFMTIPEATQLILQAATMGQGGEIYVLDMGQPVKISYLAEMMIRMAGFEPGRDVKIAYTGLRAGEKLHEELFHEHEKLLETGCRKIFRANSRESHVQNLTNVMDQMHQACMALDEPRMCGLLIQLVPEFRAPEEVAPSKILQFMPHKGKGATPAS